MSLLAIASAAPVVCDTAQANQRIEDARIDPGRIPVTQPNLIPGLARSDPAIARELAALCDGDAPLSLAPAEHWETAEFSAYSFVLTQSQREDCRLVQDAVVLTVGVEPGQPLRYGIRSHLPRTITPVGCDEVSKYREEVLLDGRETPVRLVAITDRHGDETHQRVVVRRATPTGWHEEVLLDPAPPRLTDPSASGPLLSLSVRDREPWIVAHQDREVTPAGCTPLPGQTVWRWEGSTWRPWSSRDALGRLAERGDWRLAGEDGWFLILAQDNQRDLEVLQARMRKLQKRYEEPIRILNSSSFPLMNPGFLIVVPDPWSTEEAARAAMGRWTRRTGVYVRQGWEAADPCESAP